MFNQNSNKNNKSQTPSFDSFRRVMANLTKNFDAAIYEGGDNFPDVDFGLPINPQCVSATNKSPQKSGTDSAPSSANSTPLAGPASRNLFGADEINHLPELQLLPKAKHNP